ncbi:WD40-repeat-containing domain protein [Cyathus striatus]|nr:WD40-repeat-containing domain protein [Cyathus striatus]
MFDTIFPADSLEFCPSSSASNLFVCGTYKLDETEHISDQPSTHGQHRRGQCLVFEIDFPSTNFRHIQSFDLPAILDMKWCHRSEAARPLLATADSEGGITLFEWQHSEHKLKKTSMIFCATSDTLCLSLDWSNRRFPGKDFGSMAVSLSNGSLALLEPQESNLIKTATWHAHDYEPWITAWNYWDKNVLYSGGDDLKLKCWDVRREVDEPLFVNKRFGAGVTSIQSHPFIEHLLAVGSYDNTVQLIDVRKPLASLGQVDVGGGAWRVKWHPSASRKEELLVACMHDGFKIVKFSAEYQCEVVKRFDEHSSLAYGADWCFATQNNKESLVGSCSFYDHALQLWSA